MMKTFAPALVSLIAALLTFSASAIIAQGQESPCVEISMGNAGCNGLVDGDYRLCSNCELGNYATCSNGFAFNRPCPEAYYGTNNLFLARMVFDSALGRCERTSPDCPRNL